MVKKAICIVLLIIMIGGFSGCAGKSSEVQTSQPAVEAQAAASNEQNNSTETTIEELEQISGTDINVSLGQMGEHMSLPENFPKEVLPIMEDANIINVNDNKDAKSIGIIFKTDKTFDDAIAFYKDVMKNGSVMMEDKQAASYMLMGDKDKYGIMITISKYDGEKISILLNVSMPQ